MLVMVITFKRIAHVIMIIVTIIKEIKGGSCRPTKSV